FSIAARVRCPGAHAFAGVGFGDIHICLQQWISDDSPTRVRALLHEGSHRFLSVGHGVGDYTDDERCDDTNDTATNSSPSHHLNNADSFACIVTLLVDIADDVLDQRVRQSKGLTILGIAQGKPEGPLDLDVSSAKSAKSPIFVVRQSGLAKAVQAANIPG